MAHPHAEHYPLYRRQFDRNLRQNKNMFNIFNYQVRSLHLWNRK